MLVSVLVKPRLSMRLAPSRLPPEPDNVVSVAKQIGFYVYAPIVIGA